AIRLSRRSASMSATTSVVIGEGEKLRAITVPVVLKTPEPEPERKESPKTPRKAVRVLPYALAGLGVVSAGAGALLWSSGLGGLSAALERGGCPPHCSSSVRASIHPRLVVGDVLVLVSALSLAGATYLFLRTPGAE